MFHSTTSILFFVSLCTCVLNIRIVTADTCESRCGDHSECLIKCKRKSLEFNKHSTELDQNVEAKEKNYEKKSSFVRIGKSLQDASNSDSLFQRSSESSQNGGINNIDSRNAKEISNLRNSPFSDEMGFGNINSVDGYGKYLDYNKKRSSFVRIGKASGDQDKRSSFVRIGKAVDGKDKRSSFGRIGKAVDGEDKRSSFVRIGKSVDGEDKRSSFVRIGKAIEDENKRSSFVRIGKAIEDEEKRSSFVRIGKAIEDEDKRSSFVRIGKAIEDENKRSSFVRIGKASDDVDKRGSSYVRIGRASESQEKRASPFVRIGKAADEENKRSSSFVRIGKSVEDRDKRKTSFVRIGKAIDTEEKRSSPFVRIGKASEFAKRSSFVRIGKSTPFQEELEDQDATTELKNNEQTLSPEDELEYYERSQPSETDENQSFYHIPKRSSFVRIGRSLPEVTNQFASGVSFENLGPSEKRASSTFVRIG